MATSTNNSPLRLYMSQLQKNGAVAGKQTESVTQRTYVKDAIGRLTVKQRVKLMKLIQSNDLSRKAIKREMKYVAILSAADGKSCESDWKDPFRKAWARVFGSGAKKGDVYKLLMSADVSKVNGIERVIEKCNERIAATQSVMDFNKGDIGLSKLSAKWKKDFSAYVHASHAFNAGFKQFSEDDRQDLVHKLNHFEKKVRETKNLSPEFRAQALNFVDKFKDGLVKIRDKGIGIEVKDDGTGNLEVKPENDKKFQAGFDTLKSFFSEFSQLEELLVNDHKTTSDALQNHTATLVVNGSKLNGEVNAYFHELNEKIDSDMKGPHERGKAIVDHKKDLQKALADSAGMFLWDITKLERTDPNTQQFLEGQIKKIGKKIKAEKKKHSKKSKKLESFNGTLSADRLVKKEATKSSLQYLDHSLLNGQIMQMGYELLLELSYADAYKPGECKKRVLGFIATLKKLEEECPETMNRSDVSLLRKALESSIKSNILQYKKLNSKKDHDEAYSAIQTALITWAQGCQDRATAKKEEFKKDSAVYAKDLKYIANRRKPAVVADPLLVGNPKDKDDSSSESNAPDPLHRKGRGRVKGSDDDSADVALVSLVGAHTSDSETSDDDSSGDLNVIASDTQSNGSGSAGSTSASAPYQAVGDQGDGNNSSDVSSYDDDNGDSAFSSSE